ncbi:MAG: hypothetical protein AAFZ52_11290 [Bacteroidota bacterium]
MRLKHYLYLFLLLLLVTGCGDDEDSLVLTDNEILRRADLVFSVSAEEVTQAAASFPVYFPGNRPLNGIDFYRVEYLTESPAGNTVTASGMIALPQEQTTTGMAVVHQATVLNAADVPSLQTNRTGFDPFPLALGGTGLAVLLPDNIGYGTSANILHPYQHAATYGRCGYDMIRAGLELFANQEISHDGQLYVTGYSAGGDATLAVHRWVEENSDLAVTLSVPGGGAYDKLAVAKTFADYDGELSLAPLFVWIIQTYDDLYGLDRPWSAYLTADNAAKISGSPEGQQWLQLGLDQNPQELFAPAFREAILNDSDAAFRAALLDNDLTSWQPEGVVVLLHGAEDLAVPVVGARNALRFLQADDNTVELREFAGEDHNRAYFSYITEALVRIEAARP